MSATVKFNQRFSPAEATRGQFVPIDTTTLINYPPTGSRGRYANLSYIVGSEAGALNIALSGGTVILPVSTVNINEPLRVENEPGTRLLVTVQEPLSTISLLPNITNRYSQTISSSASADISFVPTVDFVEINNLTVNRDVYITFETGVTFTDVITGGIKIEAESYYSIDRKTSDLIIANNSSGNVDVRVHGHSRS